MPAIGHASCHPDLSMNHVFKEFSRAALIHHKSACCGTKDGHTSGASLEKFCGKMPALQGSAVKTMKKKKVQPLHEYTRYLPQASENMCTFSFTWCPCTKKPPFFTFLSPSFKYAAQQGHHGSPTVTIILK